MFPLTRVPFWYLLFLPQPIGCLIFARPKSQHDGVKIHQMGVPKTMRDPIDL